MFTFKHSDPLLNTLIGIDADTLATLGEIRKFPTAFTVLDRLRKIEQTLNNYTLLLNGQAFLVSQRSNAQSSNRGVFKFENPITNNKTAIFLNLAVRNVDSNRVLVSMYYDTNITAGGPVNAVCLNGSGNSSTISVYQINNPPNGTLIFERDVPPEIFPTVALVPGHNLLLAIHPSVNGIVSTYVSWIEVEA